MPAKKRPAAAAPGHKKRRQEEQVDPVHQHCQAVADGLCRTTEVPTAVLSMLSAMSENALRSCKDERHSYQVAVVDMIGSVLDGVEAELRNTVARHQERIARSDDDRATRTAAVKAAEAHLEERKATTQTAKYTLAEDAEAYKNAKEAVASAQVAQKQFYLLLDATAKQKDRLESTVNDFFKPLAVGSATGEEAQRLAESLLASLSKFSLEESMMTALPGAITKEPSTRGSFDTSVVENAETALANLIAKATSDLAAAEPRKAQAAEALKEAEAAFENAKEKQHKSAAAYNEARSAQLESEATLKAAEQTLADLDPEVRKAQKDLEFAEKDLADFCSGAKSSFAELRDRVLPLEPEVAEEAPEAVEEEAGHPAEEEMPEAGEGAETEG